jgi:hypothetical protein
VESTTLNAMLARCVPRHKAGSKDILPSDFSKKYFAARANRTGQVWYVSSVSYSFICQIIAACRLFRDSARGLDYGFKTTVPVPGEKLETTNGWRRAYVATVLRLSTQVRCNMLDVVMVYAEHTLGRINTLRRYFIGRPIGLVQVLISCPR